MKYWRVRLRERMRTHFPVHFFTIGEGKGGKRYQLMRRIANISQRLERKGEKVIFKGKIGCTWAVIWLGSFSWFEDAQDIVLVAIDEKNLEKGLNEIAKKIFHSKGVAEGKTLYIYDECPEPVVRKIKNILKQFGVKVELKPIDFIVEMRRKKGWNT